MSERQPTALVVDDHPVVLHGVRGLLVASGDYGAVGVAETGDEACRCAETMRPNVVVLDLRVGDDLAPEICRRIRAVAPGSVVVVFTAYDDRALLKACLEAGAGGIVLKDAHGVDLVGTLRKVRGGAVVVDPRIVDPPAGGDERDVVSTPSGEVFERMTQREYEVLRLLAAGRTTAEIGVELFLAQNTVRSYIQSILAKLGARNRVQALVKARRLRLI